MLIGSLLENAEELLRMGLKPVEIIEGYEMARDKILDELLQTLVVEEVKDLEKIDSASRALRSSVMSKQYGIEDFLSRLIAQACIAVSPKGTAFNVDNVRVCKVLGSGVEQSHVIQGMVLKRQVEGTVTKVSDAKVAVYSCPVDIATTETKGTVLIKSAQELLNFSSGEENLLEQQIKGIADAGVKVVVSGGKFGDMALHFINKYGLMAVRLLSKFDVRRVASTVGARVLPRLEPPKSEDVGFCDQVYIDEIGDTTVVIMKQASHKSRISTIVVRGSTDNVMDDVERAIDDGVNTYKALTKDGRLLPGAGAVETELAVKMTSYSETLPGMEQYAVQKFAEALQSLPGSIAENAGIKSHDILLQLLAAHEKGDRHAAVDISVDVPKLINATEHSIFDSYLVKYWGIKYATSTACTILSIDQIICSKRAGGPKPREQGGDWDQD